MKKALPFLFPYAVFAFLALVSWNRWIEPYVDTGRELMVPWRVSRGEALYREIHFNHGPLAPYAGAAIDRLAGRSLGARIVFAALLALLHLEALRRLAARFLPVGRAGLATALAVALAFFLRPGGWLFPFSFDTAIAVAALSWALVFALQTTAAGDLGSALCSVCALLSRPELGLAGIAAIGIEARGRPRRLWLLALLPLTASTVVYAGVSVGTPTAKLIADGWLALIRPPEAFQNVYRAYAGLDRPGLRLAELALAAVLLALIAALLAIAAAAARAGNGRRGASRTAEGIAIASLSAAALLALRPPSALAQTFSLFPPLVRIVPLVVIAAALARIVHLATRRASPDAPAGVPDATLFIAAFFGARLLLAAGYAGPYNAFFLPLPALVACAWLWRAADTRARAIGETLPRLVTGALAVLLVFRLLVLTDAYRRAGWTRVDTPAGNLVLPEPVASTTRLALEDLDRRLPKRGKLAGFPEAGFFNYVLGRDNPLSLEQFFPGHLNDEGELGVASRLEQEPPDAVVLINVVAVGEGIRAFGKDYLVKLAAVIERRFRVAAVFGPGAQPSASIGDPQFFIEVRVPAGPAPR